MEERIICACHDAGKASKAWQKYISGVEYSSPHRHAAVGGFLAALLIKKLGRREANLWSLVALHAGAAHHSFLGFVREYEKEFIIVSTDEQAKAFFCNDIPKLLPDISTSLFMEVWNKFAEMALCSRGSFNGFSDDYKRLSGDERLKVYIYSRSILGRLCFQDHQSAAKQSGNSESITMWQGAFPELPFKRRPLKVFPASDLQIHQLRNELKAHFHASLKEESPFYFIDAPTGLGKTETMISAAEILVQKHDLSRIVFSVPQVSIADQIYEEYFDEKSDAQIWNYIRQEKSCDKPSDERIEDNNNPSFNLEVALQPFSQSYNITTFNQVLLAMCHPLRTRCIRGIGLRDAVIIMDEFHKLPMTILPYFFRIAKEFTKRHNCRFILGSATPLEKYPYLGLEEAQSIKSEFTEPLYTNPTIDNRRIYKSVGLWDIEKLTDRIESFHVSSEKNLMVVVNLISKGSWPLLKNLIGAYNPWKMLDNLSKDEDSRLVVFLDGLVPPFLRREIILKCKIAMKKRPITLITTQMVEVGVDLDFDHAFVDYQGIAATIQRGGRVGREGRSNGEACEVDVFSLVTDDETSFKVLCDVQKKYDSRLKNSSFNDISGKTSKFWKKEISFFNNWDDSEVFTDSQLIEKLRTIQQKIFANVDGSRLLGDFFSFASVRGDLGVNYIEAQHLAELFGENQGTELLILKDQNEFETLSQLVDKLRLNRALLEDKRELNKFVVGHKITVFSKDVITELGLEEAGYIDIQDNLRCLKMETSIF
ncbi:MAG: DEAD/DEAH box helicase family protein [Lentisphaeraceae bacterium]|nr:DEAD/DEAH box helicase family protein [Lentisphaeraceae bacterium]